MQEFALNGKPLDWYDYGARFYDPTLGRWHVIDPAATLFFSLSPYQYGGNSPVNTIDLDGRLFIFVNGFMTDQWMAGKQPKYIPVTRFRIPVPNPAYGEYDPDRNFNEDGPRNAGKTFQYWEQMAIDFEKAYPGEKQLFSNGSFTPRSTGTARFNEGIAAGERLIAMLENGLSLADGETIKIIGHSQGAAMAAGIATVLAQHPKYKHLLEFVLYFSPHQPGGFSHPEGISGYQFSTMSDWVSSSGPLARMLNSDYQLIKGAKWGVERESHLDGRKGHSVPTWLIDLRRWARENNIPLYE